MLKKVLLAIVAILVIIQFIRPAKNESRDFSKDISTVYPVPPDVQLIMQRACNDCHSNYTTYPWYTNIQPVGWWLQHHVDEGKEHLNFSEFASYSPKKQAHKLEEVAEEVQEHEMPLNSYTWMHHTAKLDTLQERVIAEWALALKAKIEQANSLQP